MARLSQAQMNLDLTTTLPSNVTASTSTVLRHGQLYSYEPPPSVPVNSYPPYGQTSTQAPLQRVRSCGGRAGAPLLSSTRAQMSGASVRVSALAGQSQQDLLSRRSLPPPLVQSLAYTPAPPTPAGGYPSYTPAAGNTCYTPLPLGPSRRPSYVPLPTTARQRMPSYTPLPVSARQGAPSYVPMPAASQQGMPSYTPLPGSARQGVPSYTPAAVLNQTQPSTPRRAPPAVEQAPARATLEDNTVAFMPYFVIEDAENFFDVCNQCIEKVKNEALCLGYGFSVSAGPQQNMAFCREAFLNAEGVIAHLNNIEVLFKEGLCKYGRLVSLQIHGPKRELDKLREDAIIQELGPEFYELMPGSFEVVELPMQQLSDATQQPHSETPGRSTPKPQRARVLGGGLQEGSLGIMTTPTTYMAPHGPYGR